MRKGPSLSPGPAESTLSSLSLRLLSIITYLQARKCHSWVPISGQFLFKLTGRDIYRRLLRVTVRVMSCHSGCPNTREPHHMAEPRCPTAEGVPQPGPSHRKSGTGWGPQGTLRHSCTHSFLTYLHLHVDTCMLLNNPRSSSKENASHPSASPPRLSEQLQGHPTPAPVHLQIPLIPRSPHPQIFLIPHSSLILSSNPSYPSSPQLLPYP